MRTFEQLMKSKVINLILLNFLKISQKSKSSFHEILYITFTLKSTYYFFIYSPNIQQKPWTKRTYIHIINDAIIQHYFKWHCFCFSARKKEQIQIKTNTAKYRETLRWFWKNQQLNISTYPTPLRKVSLMFRHLTSFFMWCVVRISLSCSSTPRSKAEEDDNSYSYFLIKNVSVLIPLVMFLCSIFLTYCTRNHNDKTCSLLFILFL